jgi:hypothetical protein
MIKVGDEYLEFDEPVDVVRKVKLFEAIGEIQGDFSYQAGMPDTTHNRRLLKLYSITQSDKIIYSKVPASVEGEDGVPMHVGYIFVESIKANVIYFSFFSGNSNWYELLGTPIRDLDWTAYDELITQANIISSFGNTEGLIYPLVNNGVLGKRGYINLVDDDFRPFIYVKTVIADMLAQNGFKLTGSILKDDVYNHLITSHSEDTISDEDAEEYRSVVFKNVGDVYSDGDVEQLTFDDTTQAGPYWSSNAYTAPVRMNVNAKLTFKHQLFGGEATFNVNLRRNGFTVANFRAYYNNAQWGGNPYGIKDATLEYVVTLEAGDVLDYEITLVATLGSATIYNNTTTLVIKAVKVFKVYTFSILPEKTCAEFLVSILSLFNALVTFDGFSKTINIDLFKDLHSVEPLDISQYIDESTIEENYTYLSLGNKNTFTFAGSNNAVTTVLDVDDEESETEDVEEYNKANVLGYGDGEIDANTPVFPDIEVLSVPFAPVPEDTDNPFNVSLAKTGFVEAELIGEEIDITSVTNSSGIPRFNINNVEGVVQEDFLVRISKSTVPSYNGDWVAASDTTTYFTVQGLDFVANAVAKVQVIRINTADSDQVIMYAVPGVTIDKFTRSPSWFLNGTALTLGATAYFNMPHQGLYIDRYKFAVSFGDINAPDHRQVNLLNRYWRDFANVARDPIVILVNAYLPLAVYKKIDFQRFVYLKTPKFTGLFYCNKITSYNYSILELIKVS